MQAKRSKNSGDFFGAGESGERGIPLFAKKQSNTQNLENIRENTTLRNLEPIESSADSKASIESSPTDPEASAESKADSESKAFTESSPRDSEQEQTQNLTIKESAESTMQTESKNGFRIFRFCLGLVLAHRTIIDIWQSLVGILALWIV